MHQCVAQKRQQGALDEFGMVTLMTRGSKRADWAVQGQALGHSSIGHTQGCRLQAQREHASARHRPPLAARGPAAPPRQGDRWGLPPLGPIAELSATPRRRRVDGSQPMAAAPPRGGGGGRGYRGGGQQGEQQQGE
ncbi:unnamed protein product, partial [Prorocentrum cordatum]